MPDRDQRNPTALQNVYWLEADISRIACQSVLSDRSYFIIRCPTRCFVSLTASSAWQVWANGWRTHSRMMLGPSSATTLPTGRPQKECLRRNDVFRKMPRHSRALQRTAAFCDSRCGEGRCDSGPRAPRGESVPERAADADTGKPATSVRMKQKAE